MKRIWFTQQQPFDFMPLKTGLGYVTIDELKDYENMGAGYGHDYLCPKIYTTRKSPLKGEYYVVKGSRFKAEPVEPRIEFKVERSLELNLDLEAINIGGTWVHHELLQQKETDDDIIQKVRDIFNMPPGYTFPELDLGYKGATFEDLKNVLLDCNKGATVDTPFYVNGPLMPITPDMGREDIDV